MNKVSFLDLKRGYVELKEEIDAATAQSLASGQYISGDDVKNFENAFAAYTETNHCIGVGNGLDAIRLTLEAAGIGPGHEVLVPSNTFIATWLAVSQTGAVPRPVDPDPLTHNVTAERLESAITAKTRAIITVHLYGSPAEIDAIVTLANEKDLFLIEDAAQAHGAKWQNRRIGGHSRAATWSFYPGKNLGAFGDGGAVTTNDASLAQRIRLLGNYGSEERYVHKLQGTNSRLDPIQATILSVKLSHLDVWNARRKRIAARYTKAFEKTDLILPKPPQAADPVWHLYVVRSPNRDALQKHLKERAVQTLIHYPCPPHKQDAYAMNVSLPIAEQLACEVLSLPIGPHLSDEEADQVIAAVTSFTS